MPRLRHWCWRPAELTRSLTEAFTRSGLLIDEQAKQRLSVTLGRPGDGHTDHERHLCLEVKAELQRALALERK